MPTPTTSSPHSSGQKAPLMRRQSSQSSQTSKVGVASPGSVGEYQPLRHHVKAGRRTKIVLPRNHSSARDLAKLARQAQNHRTSDEAPKNSRQRSHEGDTEIRLPGSLDEAKAQPMKRNMTAYPLPRNTSYTKLKKNLSHGQLNRIGSGKNLAGLNQVSMKGPPSPGLKNRNKRPKSADMGVIEKDMQEQEAEVAQERQEKKEVPKRVGFLMGSSGEDDEEESPDMEGSELQEDEWTDQSGSASPYSTRQNTANNSRRASMSIDKPPDKPIGLLPDTPKGKANEPFHYTPSHLTSEVKQEESGGEAKDEESDDDDDPPSPKSQPHVHVHVKKRDEEGAAQQPTQTKTEVRSPLHAAKEHPNPATRYLMTRGASAAQAQVSIIKTGDEGSSAQPSPAPSMRSSRSNIGDSTTDVDQEELVSRFIPSASHPSTGSVGGTTLNTPKSGSFQTPESESVLAAQQRHAPKPTFPHPTSPSSTISGSSGAVTPAKAMSRSRTEMRMMNEKAMADLEDAAALNPTIPPHVYDRRNESLKTYSAGNIQRNGSNASINPNFTLGPELFQGRFKAVNTELKVVQKFRDPIYESIRRMERCRGLNLVQLRGQRASTQKQAAKMPISKSAVALNKGPSKLSTSTSPPKSASPAKPALSSAKSSSSVRPSESRRGKVTFSQTPAEAREAEGSEVAVGVAAEADVIARQLWDGPMG